VAAFFMICYNTHRTQAQAQRALWTMLGIGTLVSVLGIVQRATWNHRLYWIGPEIEYGAPFGPFVNRAHFAGLMVVIVPMALALGTVLIVLAGVWIGGDIVHGTVERLAGELGRPEESPRLFVWADALKLWRAAPVVGTGFATFGVAFPPFRTLQAPVVFSHA